MYQGASLRLPSFLLAIFDRGDVHALLASRNLLLDYCWELFIAIVYSDRLRCAHVFRVVENNTCAQRTLLQRRSQAFPSPGRGVVIGEGIGVRFQRTSTSAPSSISAPASNASRVSVSRSPPPWGRGFSEHSSSGV